MILNNTKNTYLLLLLWMNFQLISCAQKSDSDKKNIKKKELSIKTGADRVEFYTDNLVGKKVAIVANQTSVVQVLEKVEVSPNVMGSKLVPHHLVDYLFTNKKIDITKVFAPEHGFRGKADAGEEIVDGVDAKTNISIISLYGKNKKPSQEQLKGVDVVLFDIQDVGARFYTYISTLHLVMEACAEANIPLILLDRPNPNGHYIDGPILEDENTSFVGMHPVPVVYGMTIGEYGQMINGEKWLKNGVQCDLSVVTLKNYTHTTKYDLPIKPSPNLPNSIAINLYPSLCFFEGTTISAGRGTEKQFQIYGGPDLNIKDFSFIPKPNEGSKFPKHENKVCYGEDLSNKEYLSLLNLSWLIKAYNNTDDKDAFFNSFFIKLAGTKKLQEQIKSGLSEKEIKESWKGGLGEFSEVRKKYLLYDN